MSEHVRPDAAAFRDLETTIRRLVDELAAFRVRAQSAEAKLKGYEGATGSASKAGARMAKLEEENAKLRTQVDAARTSTKGMLERVRFLRQQAQAAEK